jgi:hypothetical protein
VQFDPDRLRVVFYEEIVRYPERELPGLFHYLKPHLVDRMTKGALGVLTLPSRVGTTQTRKADGKWPIGRWKAELSPDQVERGLRILAHFGLDQLYGDGFMPRREFLPCRTRRESGIEPPTRAVEHCP